VINDSLALETEFTQQEKKDEGPHEFDESDVVDSVDANAGGVW
jgi:hypothetical protein